VNMRVHHRKRRIAQVRWIWRKRHGYRRKEL
jgi:hypothetical protein